MRVILYTKDFSEKINEPVDIILSPQFYWIKKIDIPIKSLKDAKKISKNIFKLNDDYLFDAFEINNTFFAYAVNKNLKLNIEKKYINSIRLAQSEFYKYNKINVSDKYSIQKIDGLMFCFPDSEKNPDIPDIKKILSDIKLSKNKINIYNRINIDKFIIINILLIFLFINAALILNTYKNHTADRKIKIQKEKLRNKYSLPDTSYQLDSILENLKETDNTQSKIKKDLAYITNIPLNKNEKFTLLNYKNSKFNVNIKTNRNLDIYFKKKFKVKSSLNNNIYKADLYE